MPGWFSTLSFSDLASELEQTTEWLARLGVDASRTRIGYYRRVISDLATAHERRDIPRLQSMYPDALTPLFEANEIVSVHRGLGRGDRDDYIRDRMRAVATGPLSYIDEDASAGNKARNFAFELMITERMVTGGLQLATSIKTDVAARVGNRTAVIECKRPQKEETVEKNVKEAKRQLKSIYRNAARPGYMGLIALDLTKLTNPDFALLRNIESDEIGHVLGDYLATYSRDHESLWREVQDTKTLAIILRVSVLAQFTNETGLTWCQQYAVSFMPGLTRLARSTAEAIGIAFEAAMQLDSYNAITVGS